MVMGFAFWLGASMWHRPSKTAPLYNQAGCMNLPGNDGLGLNFHFSSSVDCAVKAPSDHHVVPDDFPIRHGGVLTQNERVFGNQCTFQSGVDAERAGALQPAFDTDTLFQEARPLA